MGRRPLYYSLATRALPDGLPLAPDRRLPLAAALRSRRAIPSPAPSVDLVRRQKVKG